jgi:hypothetical protein
VAAALALGEAIAVARANAAGMTIWTPAARSSRTIRNSSDESSLLYTLTITNTDATGPGPPAAAA